MWNTGIWDEDWVSFRWTVMPVHSFANYRNIIYISVNRREKETAVFVLQIGDVLGFFSRIQ